MNLIVSIQRHPTLLIHYCSLVNVFVLFSGKAVKTSISEASGRAGLPSMRWFLDCLMEPNGDTKDKWVVKTKPGGETNT